MESKFYTLLQEYFDRNSVGGFLPGDIVELNHDATDAQTSDAVKSILAHMTKDKDGSRLRITNINRKTGGIAPASSLPEDLVIDVAEEIAPGLLLDPIPVPASAIKRTTQKGINLGEIPSGWKHEVKVSTRAFDPEKDTIKEPDYSKYKEKGMEILNRWIDGHDPHKRGTEFN